MPRPLTRHQEAGLLVMAIAGVPMTDAEVEAEVRRRRLVDLSDFEFACFKFDALPAIRANVDAQRALVLQ